MVVRPVKVELLVSLSFQFESNWNRLGRNYRWHIFKAQRSKAGVGCQVSGSLVLKLLVILVLVLVLLVLVPSKGQLPICYSYFQQAPTRSAQVKQPCIAFDAIRLVTKVLVLDLVHISFWQKKMVLCRVQPKYQWPRQKEQSKRRFLSKNGWNANINRRSMKNIVLAWHMMESVFTTRLRMEWDVHQQIDVHTVTKTQRYMIKSQHQEYVSWYLDLEKTLFLDIYSCLHV